MDACLVVFPDTNIFIQCKPLDELPWSKLGDHKEFHIVICPAVLSEFDRLKNDPRPRVSKHVRSISSKIRDLYQSEAPHLVIREASPRVLLMIGKHANSEAAFRQPLSRAIPDDNIIFEYMTTVPNSTEKILLTHDLGVAQKCRTLNLRHKLVPDEWVLPPETSKDEKENNRLREQIERVTATQPKIVVQLREWAGSPLKNIRDEEIDLEDDSSHAPIRIALGGYCWLVTEQEQTIEFAKRQDPMITKFKKSEPKLPDTAAGRIYALSHRALGRWLPPSEDEIAEYQSEKYPNWIEELAKWLKELPEKINAAEGTRKFTLEITNMGGAPAIPTTLELKLSDGLVFTATEEVPSSPRPPDPPKPPAGRYENVLENLSYFKQEASPLARVTRVLDSYLGSSAVERDPHKFYRVGKSHLVEINGHWKYTCQNFRQLVDVHRIRFAIRPINDERKPERGTLTIQVTANNLPIPLVRTVELQISSALRSIKQRSQELLEESKAMRRFDFDDFF